jgi:hypothetical protein
MALLFMYRIVHDQTAAGALNLQWVLICSSAHTLLVPFAHVTASTLEGLARGSIAPSSTCKVASPVALLRAAWLLQ